MTLVVPFEEIFASEEGLLARHDSWPRVELSEACAVINGFPFKSSLFNKTQGLPIIRIRDLLKQHCETLYGGEIPESAFVQNGDLLIGMDGIFRCVEWNGGTAGLNQRVCKIVPDEKRLNKKLLLFGLNGYLKAIEDATSSVTVGHLSSRDILRIPFPLPPLSEQRRIVSKLESVLGTVASCRERLAKIPTLLKRFRQSVLAAACSGRLTEDWRGENTNENSDTPQKWSVSRVEGVIENLKYGTSKKCDYDNSGIPVLRIPNISDGIVDHSNLKYATLESREFQQLRLRIGDILMIRSNGSVSLVGKTALVRSQEEDFAYAGYLIRIRPDFSKILPEYLNMVLGSYDIRLQIEINARSTSGVNNINSEEVRTLRIPLPPLAEQQEIVRRVEELFAFADRIESRLAVAQANVEKLTQSVLAKAFRGELVPTDAEIGRQADASDKPRFDENAALRHANRIELRDNTTKRDKIACALFLDLIVRNPGLTSEEHSKLWLCGIAPKKFQDVLDPNQKRKFSSLNKTAVYEEPPGLWLKLRGLLEAEYIIVDRSDNAQRLSIGPRFKHYQKDLQMTTDPLRAEFSEEIIKIVSLLKSSKTIAASYRDAFEYMNSNSKLIVAAIV